jgi:hypothetical protein
VVYSSDFTGGYSYSSPSDFYLLKTRIGFNFNNRPDISGRKKKYSKGYNPERVEPLNELDIKK